MSTPELNEAAWRKSSYSGSGGDCVEVADLASLTAIRDSKDTHGPALTFADAAWAAFVADVKRTL